VTVTAFRIAQAAYADTLWSGIGARDFGGRWNSRGVAVVYTAQSRSLAAMEQLVHLVKPRVLQGYVLATIIFDESMMQRITVPELPDGWNDPVAPSVLKRIGDVWVAEREHVALAVPSAIMPGEWNYLLNPAHRNFKKLVKTPPQQFVYDRRLE
jgi:RES domain-containing protein